MQIGHVLKKKKKTREERNQYRYNLIEQLYISKIIFKKKYDLLLCQRIEIT